MEFHKAYIACARVENPLCKCESWHNRGTDLRRDPGSRVGVGLFSDLAIFVSSGYRMPETPGNTPWLGGRVVSERANVRFTHTKTLTATEFIRACTA